MPRSLRVFALATALLAACAGGKPEATDDFTALAGADQKSDVFSANMKIVGSLDYGQTSDPVAYKNPPRYRAFKFGGAKGDAVDIWVRSATGDAIAWLLDDSFKIIAKNDDASSSTVDSHITATLLGNKNPSIITYYIVFRDYDLTGADFTVALAKTNCVQNVFCIQGSHFDSKACKCVPNVCVQNVLCVMGSTWDPKQCQCVPTGCDYNGAHYGEGASFPAGDGCNHCSCSASRVVCTKIACPLGCNYGGTIHPYGSSFPSTDGCNSCTCTQTGNVICTQRACVNDCRLNGCGSGQDCVFCWGSYACIPHGAVC